MLKKTVMGIMFFLTLTAIFPTLLLAQVTYSVSPSKLEIFAGKGEAVSKTIQIYNKQNVPVKIKAYIMDYKINPDNTFIFSPPGSQPYSAANWITLPKTNLVVLAQKVAKIPLTIRIPANAEVGGHYAVIFFESAQKVKKEGLLRGRIGSLMLVTVKGRVNRQGEIQKLNVINPILSTGIKTEAIFINKGNVHITARGEVLFFGSNKKQVGKETLGEITILPKTKRIMNALWKDKPLYGKFKAVANIYYGFDLNTFNIKKSAEKSFYIIPWFYIFILTAILAAIAIYLLVRYFRKKRT